MQEKGKRKECGKWTNRKLKSKLVAIFAICSDASLSLLSSSLSLLSALHSPLSTLYLTHSINICIYIHWIGVYQLYILYNILLLLIPRFTIFHFQSSGFWMTMNMMMVMKICVKDQRSKGKNKKAITNCIYLLLCTMYNVQSIECRSNERVLISVSLFHIPFHSIPARHFEFLLPFIKHDTHNNLSAKNKSENQYLLCLVYAEK